MVRVELAEVCKRFGTVVALHEVALVIEPGELFFLLGPSGCGKTTLLRCLAGFCAPDAGRIRFDATDVTGLAPHRRETGMVFQSYALWPHMTVERNVAFGLEVKGLSRTARAAAVAAALRAVQLDGLAERKPNELSGGQQQRVALARALVVEPKCLLLDEPLSNLDAKLRLEMRHEIRAICKRAKLTAVYVTHDQKEALSMADRIAVMRAGRVVQVGTPEELYRRPTDRFVAGFLGESNFVEGTVREAAAGVVRIETSLGLIVSTSAPTDLGVGCRVVCSIRPETVRLEAAPAGAENAFRGRVTERVYLGEMARYVVQAGAQSLSAFELNPRAAALPGDAELPFWIDREDVVVIAE